jgi:hypothetical protein
MGTVGCYTLDVYCDDPRAGEYKCTAWPGQFTGHTKGEAKRDAREHGWKFGRGEGEGEGTAVCPRHQESAPPSGERE